MHQKIVCPYYGKNEDDCDVGCGYISPHDVSLIIKHCSATYQECLKYRELSERVGSHEKLPEQTGETAARQRSTTADGGLHEPSAWGFLALGSTMLLLGFFLSGILDHPGAAGIGLLYCGAWQLLVGVSEWKRDHPFGAVSFSACGLFSFSLLPMLILPRTGWGFAPESMALSAYLAMWSIFAILLFIGASQYRMILQAVFGCLAVQIALLGAGSAVGHGFLLNFSAASSMVGGLLGLYSGIALLLCRNSATHRLPLGPQRKAS